MKIIKGPQAKPRRVLLYGTHGVGKSTWAAQSPSPIFLATEEGLDDIGADRTPLLASVGDVSNCFSWLLTEKHDYRTLVIDTLDWLERLVWKQTCEKHEKRSIEDFGYGKGYVHALKGWEWILTNLQTLRNERAMNIVLLAHAKVSKFEAPDAATYDRYEPDLHKTVAPMLQEWCDEVFFASYQVATVKVEEGFGRDRFRGVGTGERQVHTCEMPSHLAKRRIALPDQLPLEWAAYQEHWPQGQKQKAGDVTGIVKDGSSKQGAKA